MTDSDVYSLAGTNNTTEGGIKSIPADVLSIILFHAVLLPCFVRFNYCALGRSPWSYNLRVTKCIVSVCSLWRELAVQHLYQAVAIFRPGHPQALLDALRAHPEHGNHVQSFELSGCIELPEIHSTVSTGSILREIFQLCPNISILSLYMMPGFLPDEIDWDVAFGPLVNRITDLRLDSTSDIAMTQFTRVLGPNLTTLTIGSDAVFADSDTTVRESIVRLPNLHSLTCHVDAGMID